MDTSSRALCKFSLFPCLICSYSSDAAPLRRIAKRTVRMASLNPSDGVASSAATTDAATSPAATTDTVTSASSAIDFLSLCHRLKTTKRAGWVRRGVREPESVADHMYRMGVMAFVASYNPGIDRERCIKMALVHDIAEAIVGDITPVDGVPKEEKSRREKDAIDHMCSLLGGGSRAREMHELWMEYEENSSLEAKIVKDFDKVEMILQALEYEQVLMTEINLRFVGINMELSFVSFLRQNSSSKLFETSTNPCFSNRRKWRKNPDRLIGIFK